MSLINLLDAAKAVTGSDNATASAIGCGRSFISNIRAGRANMPARKAAQLAELVGADWQTGVLAALEAQASNDEERGFWSRLIKQSGKGLTVLAMAVVIGFSTPKTAYAFEHINRVETIHYAH